MIKKENTIGNGGFEQNIDQVQFKNLVKNRLIKDKERNKENAVNADIKQQAKQVEMQKTTII